MSIKCIRLCNISYKQYLFLESISNEIGIEFSHHITIYLVYQIIIILM